jgi:hypothetical protein
MIALLGASLPAHCNLQAADQTLAQNAFRGIAFGSPIEEVTSKGWDLTPVNDSNGDKPKLQAYIRNDEKKSLGDINCQEITYYFLNGKFFGVLLQTADSTQTEILKEALSTKRGKPFPSNGGLVWVGQNSSVILRLNESSSEGTFLIFDNMLQAEYEKYVKEVAGVISREL